MAHGGSPSYIWNNQSQKCLSLLLFYLSTATGTIILTFCLSFGKENRRWTELGSEIQRWEIDVIITLTEIRLEWEGFFKETKGGTLQDQRVTGFSSVIGDRSKSASKRSDGRHSKLSSDGTFKGQLAGDVISSSQYSELCPISWVALKEGICNHKYYLTRRSLRCNFSHTFTKFVLTKDWWLILMYLIYFYDPKHVVKLRTVASR